MRKCTKVLGTMTLSDQYYLIATIGSLTILKVIDTQKTDFFQYKES